MWFWLQSWPASYWWPCWLCYATSPADWPAHCPLADLVDFKCNLGTDVLEELLLRATSSWINYWQFLYYSPIPSMRGQSWTCLLHAFRWLIPKSSFGSWRNSVRFFVMYRMCGSTAVGKLGDGLKSCLIDVWVQPDTCFINEIYSQRGWLLECKWLYSPHGEVSCQSLGVNRLYSDP